MKAQNVQKISVSEISYPEPVNFFPYGTISDEIFGIFRNFVSMSQNLQQNAP